MAKAVAHKKEQFITMLAPRDKKRLIRHAKRRQVTASELGREIFIRALDDLDRG